jgi:hypothetical protein
MITTTHIRRDPPDTRWLAELTLPDGRVLRRRGPSKEAAEAMVREAAAEVANG